ncbi:MAG: MFS transporter, partial [Chitinophagaceae bacterium]|nr:MFS transporter [Chitinophagaceae bacterium]
NGCTEAACNPMIADMYSGDKMSKMLGRFHMWFPGGIVIGSLISKFMTDRGMSWQAQMWVTMAPTIIYFILFFGKSFPKPKLQISTSLAENLKAMATPTYIFLFVCMSLTAISEFGPEQWTGLIMSKSGASPMLILALVTGLMAVGRFFSGTVTHILGQTGVLLMGAIFSAIGIFLLSTKTGNMAYVAAIFFAIGVCFFWPTMIGSVAQRVPLSGALGMSIVGGVGMFSTAIWQPIIGSWIDKSTAVFAASGLTGDQLELAAGQSTLAKMVYFPGILIVLFLIFFFWQKRVKPSGISAAH